MDYNLNIISRDQIPADMYLCERSNNREWELIHLFEFNNGLKYILGANFPQQVDDIIECINNDIDHVIGSNSPDELQEYYYKEFESFYKYKDCVKIWNYYHSNHNLIREVIQSYNTDEGVVDN